MYSFFIDLIFIVRAAMSASTIHRASVIDLATGKISHYIRSEKLNHTLYDLR